MELVTDTTTENLKRLMDNNNLYACLRRLYDAELDLGKHYLAVVDIDDNGKEFYIKERVFYGAGFISRKIKNYYFFTRHDRIKELRGY